MHKAAYFLSLLLATVAVSNVQVNRVSAATAHSHPQIVTSVALSNQTNEIPTTTLFTPQQTGLYRVVAYLTATHPGDGQNVWGLQIQWSDDAGIEQSCLPNLNNAATPPFAYVTPSISAFEAVAGVPVTYSVFSSGQPVSGAYSLYLTVERLQ